MAKRGYATFHSIRRALSNLDINTFRSLFCSFVRPHLEFCIQAFNSGLVCDLSLLDKVQRRSSKFVPCLRNSTFEVRSARLDLFPLDYRRIRGDLILTFTLFLNNQVERFFSIGNSQTLRGHSKKLYKERPNSSVRLQFFSHRKDELKN